MKLKIFASNKERFESNLIRFLNLSTLICLGGSIPSQYDIENAENLGRWWIKEEDNNRFQLLGISNNDWVNIHEEGENFIIVEFNFRYDKGSYKKVAISNLMLAFFDFIELI
jgi:hypothetical protein